MWLSSSEYEISSNHIVVQLLSRVQPFVNLWTAARQASLSFTISQSLLKVMSIEWMMPSNHLILCHLFSSCPHSFPASGSFLMSQIFTSGGQSLGASNLAFLFPGIDFIRITLIFEVTWMWPLYQVVQKPLNKTQLWILNTGNCELFLEKPCSLTTNW